MITSAHQTSYAPLDHPQRYERIAARLADDVRAGRLAPGERLPSERDLARRLGVGRASLREALAALALDGVLETRPGSGSFVAPGAPARLVAAGSGDAADRAPPDASPSELLEARLALEPRVARLAARRGGADAEVERLLDAMDELARRGTVTGMTGGGRDGAAAGGRHVGASAADRAAWNDADRRFHHRLAALCGNRVLLSLADHVAALMDQPLWQSLRDASIERPGLARVHAAEHRLIYAAIVEGDGAAAELHATQHLERVRRAMTLDQE